MEHVDEQVLALMALGENVPGHDHVESCSQCRREVEELAAVVAAVRSVEASPQPADELTGPPASVWAEIHAELGLDAEFAADPLQNMTVTGGAYSGQIVPDQSVTAPNEDAPDEDSSMPDAAPRLRSVPAAPETSSDESGVGTAIPAPAVLRPRRRLIWAVAGAAAAGLVVGGVGVAVVKSGTPGAGPVVAEVTLDQLEGWTAEGNARVVQAKDGSQELLIDMPTVVDDEGYREVWLIDTKVERLVSLGMLTGPEATFAIPEGLDIADFPVVDISLEQFDGDPTHSGDSILRGILPT